MSTHTGFKKLALRRETLRTLSGNELDAANGGAILVPTSTVNPKLTIGQRVNDTVFHFNPRIEQRIQPKWNDTIAHPGRISVGKFHIDDTLAHPTQNGRPIPL